MTDTHELVAELRMIGCHANGDARCTCGIGQDAADTLTALSERCRVLEEEKAALREAILREAAAICKRIRLQSDLSEDERVGVLECALALTDEANAARAALAGGRE